MSSILVVIMGTRPPATVGIPLKRVWEIWNASMTHTFGFSLGKPIGCCPVAMNNSQFEWLLMTEFLGIRRDSFAVSIPVSNGTIRDCDFFFVFFFYVNSLRYFLLFSLLHIPLGDMGTFVYIFKNGCIKSFL